MSNSADVGSAKGPIHVLMEEIPGLSKANGVECRRFSSDDVECIWFTGVLIVRNDNPDILDLMKSEVAV